MLKTGKRPIGRAAQVMRKKLHLNLSHKGLLLVSVPLFFELVFIVTLYVLLVRADEQAKLLENKRAISAQANQIAKHVYDSAQGMMCYINRGKSRYGKRYASRFASTS